MLWHFLLVPVTMELYKNTSSRRLVGRLKGCAQCISQHTRYLSCRVIWHGLFFYLSPAACYVATARSQISKEKGNMVSVKVIKVRTYIGFCGLCSGSEGRSTGKDEQEGHLPSQMIIIEAKGHSWLRSNVEKNAAKNICTSLREKERKGIEWWRKKTKFGISQGKYWKPHAWR